MSENNSENSSGQLAYPPVLGQPPQSAQQGQLDYSGTVGQSTHEQAVESPALSEDALSEAMQAEVSLLEEIDPYADLDFQYETPTPELLDRVRVTRLLAQDNVVSAGDELLKSALACANMPTMDHKASMERVQALKLYLTTITPGDSTAIKFLNDTAGMIYTMRTDIE